MDTKKAWEARKDVIYPLKKPSLCALKRARDEKGFPTLGFFKPKTIKKLVIEPIDPNWSDEQLAALRQIPMFQQAPTVELEKVPFNFKYDFTCDDVACTGHCMMCTDWEMGQSWRSWRDKYGDDWEAKFREKYETQMVHKLDTHFYVGTVHKHPMNWIIVGLFYPPKVEAKVA